MSRACQRVLSYCFRTGIAQGFVYLPLLIWVKEREAPSGETVLMKRHPALLGLSREHHTSLSLARRAQRAAESGDAERIAGMAGVILSRFPSMLEPHFLFEERIILPPLARAGQSDLVRQTMTEHTQLRGLCGQLHTPEAAILVSFADALIAHVRFEERTLFEALQSLGDETLLQAFVDAEHPA